MKDEFVPFSLDEDGKFSTTLCCCVDAGHIGVILKGVYKEEDPNPRDAPMTLWYRLPLPPGKWGIRAKTRGWFREDETAETLVDLPEGGEILIGDACYWMDDGEYRNRWVEAMKGGGCWGSREVAPGVIYLNTGGDGGIEVSLEVRRHG